MRDSITTNTDDLQMLLERLYPDVHISRRGVALLAVQISELENQCELIRYRIDHAVEPTAMEVKKTRAPWPLTIHRRNTYGTNYHTK